MGNQAVCGCCGHNRTSPTPPDNRVIRVLIVGLDNAGKTTAAKGFVGEPVLSPAPTLGFSRLEARRRGWRLEMFDVGGGRTIRGIWRNYLAECHGIVYVVDASDPQRTDECRAALHALLHDHRVAGKPVLLLANKQDVASALDEVELNERLQLEAVANQNRCPMRIELCAARTSGTAAKHAHPALHAGFNWLADFVIDNYPALNGRVMCDMSERAAEVERQVQARQERVRRSREAAAAAAAAAAQAQQRTEEVSSPSTALDSADSVSPPQPSDNQDSSPELTSPNASSQPRPSSSPLPAIPHATAGDNSGANVRTRSGGDSPHTPLNPELEAQIQEVFTRTEMGRRARDCHPATENGRASASSRESWMRGALDDSHDRQAQLTLVIERRPLDSVTPDTSQGQAEERGSGSGRLESGVEPGRAGDRSVVTTDDGGGDEGRAATQPQLTNGTPSSETVPEPPRLEKDPGQEKDSGQGSVKESDSEQLASSFTSQMSNGVLDSSESGPRKRNRFFKRYTKTAPMPADDVLMTSISSNPPSSK